MGGQTHHEVELVTIEQRSKQLRWDRHFTGLALYHAKLSKDPSTQVGSVIIGPDREILSAGFNGFPRGIADTAERLNDRDTKLKLAVARAHGYTGDMKDLTEAQATGIAKQAYWDVLELDAIGALSSSVANKLFDMGFLMGIGMAGLMLQRASGRRKSRGSTCVSTRWERTYHEAQHSKNSVVHPDWFYRGVCHGAQCFCRRGTCVPGGLFMFLAGTYAEAFSWRCHWRRQLMDNEKLTDQPERPPGQMPVDSSHVWTVDSEAVRDMTDERLRPGAGARQPHRRAAGGAQSDPRAAHPQRAEPGDHRTHEAQPSARRAGALPGGVN